MRTLSLIAIPLVLTACSVYESSGRKYLEKSAYDLAGLKVAARLVGCATPVSDADWTDSDAAADPRARRLRRDTAHGFELRIEPRDRRYACDYVFTTATERDQSEDLAVTATLAARP